MNRLSQDDAAAALGWLAGSGLTGFAPYGWEASVWLLHSMYETEQIPSGISHDEVHRIQRSAGDPNASTGYARIDELIDTGTVIGGVLGPSRDPGSGWRRLRWRELAQRLDVDPFDLEVPPCFRSFPYQSWPANIAPPAEGSLDLEQFDRLLDHLARSSLDGWDTTCTAYRSAVATGNFDSNTVFECELRELSALYDETSWGAPNNVWPDDRSWFTYTNDDLWATRISGSHHLIKALAEDEQIEAISLDF